MSDLRLTHLMLETELSKMSITPASRQEYEAGESPEARLVHDLDKYDMILQAFEYEQREGRKGWLQQFFDSTKGVCKHPKVVQWVEEVYRRRAQQ